MANVMTKQGSLDNVITYEHYCDTADDLINIPKNQITLGSVAVVLEDEEAGGLQVYLANSRKQWIPVLSTGGGEDEIEEYTSYSTSTPSIDDNLSDTP